MRKIFWIIVFVVSSTLIGFAQKDTIKVMTYNVLNYGDGCQGNNTKMHDYLNTIINFTKPDIIGLVKMNVIPLVATTGSTTPYGFADSVVNLALTPNTGNLYKAIPFTNNAQNTKAVSVLFYNSNKIGYISQVTLSSYISDFNLYKLYYKAANLSTSKDTTFIYVVLNHTQSGSDATDRNTQGKQILDNLNKKFVILPNILMMGDFNMRNTSETFYQNYVSNTDSNFVFYDTPFLPDKKLSYPLNWDANANVCPNYLTTSTRQSTLPNACGTTGGGKGWYDHILISKQILKNQNRISYVPNSYQTIGNDGNRVGLSINDSTSTIKNSSAPVKVIDALFNMSNKYPVMLNLAINTTLTGIKDAVKTTAVKGTNDENENFANVWITNPSNYGQINIDFGKENVGKSFEITVFDDLGSKKLSKTIICDENIIQVPFSLANGIYLIEVLNKIDSKRMVKRLVIQ